MADRFQALIDQLAAPLQELRDRARAQLLAAGAAAVPALTRALSHPERDIRAGAALCLGSLGAEAEQAAAGKLAELAAADPDRSLRPLALRSLADLAHPRVAPVIRTALLAQVTAEDLFARALACTGLGRIGDQAANEALKKALGDREAWVREAAARAIAGGGSPSAPSAPASVASTALARPSEIAGAAVAGLASLDLETQRRAQAKLVEIGAAAVPRVALLLHDGEATTRRAAAETLGRIGSAEALPHLEALLAKPETSDELRAVALHAIASLIRRAGSEPLAPSLSDLLRAQLGLRDRFVRAAAAVALLSAQEPDRVDLIERLLDDDDEWVRSSASRALALVATPLDRPILPGLLDALARTTEEEGQLQLVLALGQVLATPHPEDGAAVIGPVSFFLKSAGREIRSEAASLIARLVASGEPSEASGVSAPPIEAAMLQDLLAVLEESPTVALVRAVALLSRRGQSALPVPTLRKLLLGRDPSLAREAAEALGRIGGRAAIDLLVEIANGRVGPATALCAQTLAVLDPRSEVVATRRPDGRWERTVQLLCACGGGLRFVEREAREELRCPACDAEYVLTAAGKLYLADRVPFGLCLCPGCRRKQPLVRRADSETLVCPISGEVHVRPFDHPRQLRRLADLPLGACACCAEPQPLVRVNEELRCYRSRRLYQATPRGFEPAEPAAPAADDLAAINRALLLGGLGIAQSGLATGRPSDDDDEPSS
jgi:HEAT repeat protein